ncbi:MAG TPA: antitoxin Xre/MbcA/ParS toxin-binding domain-containing protein [Solirubrobacteraceae bacterium]|nr:antitoxin Xre/MbcA/ParS toxin-binding domain-containing protein [Solirubrobacteraceae bacterium]
MSSPATTPKPLVREAVYLHEIAQLTDSDIARATGVARSTARAWLAHTRSPTGERAERLIELSALVERLARVMDPAYIAVWLRKPVPALQEQKPIDVIAAGDYMRVAELVSELEEASFS